MNLGIVEDELKAWEEPPFDGGPIKREYANDKEISVAPLRASSKAFVLRALLPQVTHPAGY